MTVFFAFSLMGFIFIFPCFSVLVTVFLRQNLNIFVFCTPLCDVWYMHLMVRHFLLSKYLMNAMFVWPCITDTRI